MPEGSAQAQQCVRPKIVFPHASLTSALVIAHRFNRTGPEFDLVVELTLSDGSEDKQVYEFRDSGECEANQAYLHIQLGTIRGLTCVESGIICDTAFWTYLRLCSKHETPTSVRMMGVSVIHECPKCVQEVEEWRTRNKPSH